MRIVTVSHSNAHARQAKFWRQLAVLGHDVLVLCPSKWGTLAPEPYKVGYQQERYSEFEIRPLEVFGQGKYAPDMYTFTLIGLEKAVLEWKPDVVYIQQEVVCRLTQQAKLAADAAKARTAIFVWENLHPLEARGLSFLQAFDLVVCGNDKAAALHPHRNQVFLPQVGVDTDHFSARPDVERLTDVGYIGRPVEEKGIKDLEIAWPSTKITPWTEWLKLPWALSAIKILAAPSRDTNFWHEQAMPYAAAEAAACGSGLVVSNAGAIPWWWKGGYCEPCEAAIVVEQGNPTSLRRGIVEALDSWEARGKACRAWVQENLSSLVIAKKLVKALEDIV